MYPSCVSHSALFPLKLSSNYPFPFSFFLSPLDPFFFPPLPSLLPVYYIYTLPFSSTPPLPPPFPPLTSLLHSSPPLSSSFLSPLLSASLDYIPEAFQNSQVSFADFCSDLTLLNNPNLVVRVAGK